MDYLFHKVFFHTENILPYYWYNKEVSPSHLNMALVAIMTCTLTQITSHFKNRPGFISNVSHTRQLLMSTSAQTSDIKILRGQM